LPKNGIKNGVEAARAASRRKNTYLSSKYHRIAARRGATAPLLQWSIGF